MTDMNDLLIWYILSRAVQLDPFDSYVSKRLCELYMRALPLERASSRKYQCDDDHLMALEACASTILCS
jgi:hypothetical protein